MTEKKKAKELVKKFSRHQSDENYHAKKCALICVDEIISQGGTKNLIQYKPQCFTTDVYYWKEVKQEINKL